jgi:dTMP kinase
MIRQVLQHRLFVPDVSGPRTFAWSTMALLFAADRLDHLDSTVLPALRDGAVVISDRYDLSSVAYQSATAPGGEAVTPWIRQLNSCALRPDLTVVINVPLEVAEARRHSRGGKEEIFENRAIQERLVGLYERAEELTPGDNIVHVSGVGEQPEVAVRIVEAIRAALPALELA